MAATPDSDRTATSQAPRPLPRPDEEVVDQGLGFDLGTVLNRRRILGAFGLGVAGLGLAACGANAGAGSSTTSAAATTASGEIPDETAGPYPGDGSKRTRRPGAEWHRPQ